MTRIHVLSPGFDTPNGRAFLFPMLVWRCALREAGFDCRIFKRVTANLADCDVLLVDSKFHRDRWDDDAASALVQFQDWAGRCRVIYCDTTDSSGWLQPDVLAIVHGYAKAQLLKDRARYLVPMYGQRPFSDYYHHRFGVADADPEWSKPVQEPAHLDKLRVSWNSGMTDHSLYGPARGELYRRIPLQGWLRFPQIMTRADAPRPKPVSCRFGISYPRASVSYQRSKIRELVGSRLDTGKLGRRGYFQELSRSRVIVSPFGYGEITLKDFEVFLTGGLLLKPDMSHVDTWPDLFVSGQTMLAHAWDLSDFMTVLARAEQDIEASRAVADAGQQRYRAHTLGSQAAELFVAQFKRVVGG